MGDIPLDLILKVTLIVFGASFGACVLFLLAHAYWRAALQQRNESILRRSRIALSAIVTGGDAEGHFLRVLRSAPGSMQSRMLVDLAGSLTGDARANVARVATLIGLDKRARKGLASRRWSRRLHAARQLQELQVEGNDFLMLLRDPNPAVRAQAAEWAGQYPHPDVAAALLPLLDDDSTLSRYAVQDALLRIGRASVEPLAATLRERNGARALPALRVGIAIAQPSLVEPAVRLCNDPMPAVRVLAVQLLGAVGGPNAADALAAALRDDAAEVRTAAVRGLGRIAHWPSAPAVAELLRDSSWDVRHNAGLALRRMGAPGRLLLLRMREDTDAFAADMARQVLELPRGAEAGL